MVYINWVYYNPLSGITYSTPTDFRFDLGNGGEAEISYTAQEFSDAIRRLAEVATFPTRSMTSFSFELDQSLDSEDEHKTDDTMEENDELDKFLDSFIIVEKSK